MFGQTLADPPKQELNALWELQGMACILTVPVVKMVTGLAGVLEGWLVPFKLQACHHIWG